MRTSEVVGAWFAKTREEKGLTQLEIAQAVDLTHGRISQMETQGFSYKRAKEIADSLGWEIPSLADMLRKEPLHEETVVHIACLGSINPKMEKWQGEIFQSMDVFKLWIKAQFPALGDRSKLALCPPHSDTMHPTLEAGDTLVVDASVEKFDSEGLYIFAYQGDIYMNRIQRIPGIGIKVLSDNREKYPEYILEQEALRDIEVIAKVIGKFSYKKL